MALRIVVKVCHHPFLVGMDAWRVLCRAHNVLLVVTGRVRVGSTGGPDAATHTAISRSRTRLGLWWESPAIVTLLHQETH